VILLLLQGLSLTAQDWRTINANNRAVFKADSAFFGSSSADGLGQIRGIQLNKVDTIAGKEFYYPTNTGAHIQQCLNSTDTYCGDSNTGNWIAKQMVRQGYDETYLNYNGDSILFKTDANLGSSWLMIKDTADRFFNGTVIALDTTTIEGYLDSIKIIKITSVDSLGNSLPSAYDTLKIILSKNFGWLRTISWRAFPLEELSCPIIAGLDILNSYDHHRFIMQRVNDSAFANASIKYTPIILKHYQNQKISVGTVWQHQVSGAENALLMYGFPVRSFTRQDSVVSVQPASNGADSCVIYRIGEYLLSRGMVQKPDSLVSISDTITLLNYTWGAKVKELISEKVGGSVNVLVDDSLKNNLFSTKQPGLWYSGGQRTDSACWKVY
jgi:hypothetical protein